ncbi:MAG: AbrB/MazE/SpoVT family DNA-binding domain-containing protein [Dehalococcoidaceae bacterium]|nr:AbrB/MazE/SpoVT family DNA-binding domain-containing protein [Dehalococcoidaceae bacterium]
MKQEKTREIVIRPKRQVTIPREVCKQLGIDTGDILELSVEGSVLIAKPRKAAAVEALKEIRAAFERSGLTEAELTASARQARQQIAGEHYAGKA